MSIREAIHLTGMSQADMYRSIREGRIAAIHEDKKPMSLRTEAVCELARAKGMDVRPILMA